MWNSLVKHQLYALKCAGLHSFTSLNGVTAIDDCLQMDIVDHLLAEPMCILVESNKLIIDFVGKF